MRWHSLGDPCPGTISAALRQKRGTSATSLCQFKRTRCDPTASKILTSNHLYKVPLCYNNSRKLAQYRRALRTMPPPRGPSDSFRVIQAQAVTLSPKERARKSSNSLLCFQEVTHSFIFSIQQVLCLPLLGKLPGVYQQYLFRNSTLSVRIRQSRITCPTFRYHLSPLQSGAGTSTLLSRRKRRASSWLTSHRNFWRWDLSGTSRSFSPPLVTKPRTRWLPESAGMIPPSRADRCRSIPFRTFSASLGAWW